MSRVLTAKPAFVVVAAWLVASLIIGAIALFWPSSDETAVLGAVIEGRGSSAAQGNANPGSGRLPAPVPAAEIEVADATTASTTPTSASSASGNSGRGNQGGGGGGGNSPNNPSPPAPAPNPQPGQPGTSRQNFTISGDLDELLYPGAARTLELELHNPNAFPIRVTELGATATGTNGCPGGNITFTKWDELPTVPGRGTATTTVTVTLSHTSTDACKNKTFGFTYSGRAVQA